MRQIKIVLQQLKHWHQHRARALCTLHLQEYNLHGTSQISAAHRLFSGHPTAAVPCTRHRDLAV